MDERRRAISNYFNKLDEARKEEPTLRHYCKKTLEANIIKIYKGDDVIIKVEEEDEATAYRQAQSRLESRMR